MIVYGFMLLLRKILFILAIYVLFYYLKKIFFQTNKHKFNFSQNNIQAAYKDLNLQTNASLEEVKSQYRTLSKKYHPDTNTNSSLNAQKMQSINAAYSLLKKHLENK